MAAESAVLVPLSRFFGEGINPIGLFAGALIPTIVAALAFRLL
jgi:hypothetical protein